MHWRNLALRTLLVLLMATLCGCSSFRRDARLARARGIPETGIGGLWVGRWQESGKAGHSGEIQMVLTPVGDTLYRASSRSRWRKIFTSAYDVRLVVIPIAPDRYVVQGGKDLWLFGTYTLKGHVDSERFLAEFTVAGHRGTLDLSRPKAGVASP